MKNFTITVAVSALVLLSGHAVAQAPNDAQIASIVVTANQVDIDAGKLAESKGSNAEVKAFGKQMVTDHSGVNKQAVALVTKLKVTPEDNDTSKSLKAGGADNVKNLQKLSGAAFDKAYVDHEVRLPPDGPRRARQDARPERAERRAEGPAGRGPAGLRCSPRACQGPAGQAREVGLSRCVAPLARGPRARGELGRRPRPGRRAGRHGRADKARTHEVVIQGLLYVPETLTVRPGRRRRLDQQGSVPAHGHGRRRLRLRVDRGRQVVALEGRQARHPSVPVHAPHDDEGHPARRVMRPR
jgi:putative membrane protein